MEIVTGLLNGTLAGATPILLAALGGAFTWFAGIFNIAMEGMLLAGAFFAVLGSWATGSWLVGVLAAVAGSLLLALLFVVFAVWLRADEFLTGIALNLVSLGGTTYLMRQMFGVKGAFTSDQIVGMPDIGLGFLRPLPVIGPVLASQNLLVWGALAATTVTWYAIYRSRFGLRLRAAGYRPESLESSGVPVARMRVWSLVICAVLCGLGGAYLSLGYVTLFSENMSAGRGWISLAAVILVSGRPWGIALISLVFGFTDGLGLMLQRVLPVQFTAMVPYVATMIALWVYSRSPRARSGTPATLRNPRRRGRLSARE